MTRHRALPARIAGHVAALMIAAALCACASLPPPQPNPVSHAITDVADTSLARIAQASREGQPAEASGFRPLPEGGFAIEARIALARRAEKSLDVQYYQIQQDRSGLLLLRELRDAARRGVRVRVIVDDLYAAGEDELLAGLAAHPNVELRMFNPLPVRRGGVTTRIVFSLHEFGRINHRMHNKLFVADHSFAIAGGRNIADEYFMRADAANFVDMDLLASGPVVAEFSAAFDAYWNCAYVVPIERIAKPSYEPAASRRRFDELVGDPPDVQLRRRDVLHRLPVSQELAAGNVEQIFGPARVVADPPDKISRTAADDREEGTVTQAVLGLFASARKKVLIVSPYFIPGERGLAMMRKGAELGGQTILLTNSLGATDEPLVYWKYARYRAAMLQAGVRIHELSPTLVGKTFELGDFGASRGRLHAKMAEVDDRWLFVGSMNLDGRSARLNTEIGLIIDSPPLVADLQRLRLSQDLRSAYRLRLAPDGQGVEWLENGPNGEQIVHTDEPDGNPLLWLKNWLISPFVMEELL
jgi:putative cardiolipin synthase